MTEIQFKFGVNQAVTLSDNNRTGIVHGLNYTRSGECRYLVRYCNAIESIIDEWFDERDLAAV